MKYDYKLEKITTIIFAIRLFNFNLKYHDYVQGLCGLCVLLQLNAEELQLYRFVT